METALEYSIAALVLTGAAFALIGSFGLARFSDFYKRLHGPTKATTLGVGAILIAAMLYPLLRGEAPSPRELLITVFLFLTAPVSAHMLAKAALKLDPEVKPAPPDPL